MICSTPGSDVLLYDLTSTSSGGRSAVSEGDKRKHGYSRDHRPDCVQVVIALIVTLRRIKLLAYEVLAGNTSDKTTLKDFLDRIERHAMRVPSVSGLMPDRGIPTEEVLIQMRASDPPVQYLVGTPKGRLSKLEQLLLARPWQQARENVAVKLAAQDGELLCSLPKVAIASPRNVRMRRRQLKWLWRRLAQISAAKLTREELLMKLWLRSEPDTNGSGVLSTSTSTPRWQASPTGSIARSSPQARRREGRYLLRTNLYRQTTRRGCGNSPF